MNRFIRHSRYVKSLLSCPLNGKRVAVIREEIRLDEHASRPAARVKTTPFSGSSIATSVLTMETGVKYRRHAFPRSMRTRR